MIRRDSEVLLGLKKRGFGVGKWNGFGGKVEAGETIEEATKREVLEEVGLRVENLEKIGILSFTFKQYPDDLEVYVFQTSEFFGQPKETEEMQPRWFLFDSVPIKEMWADDPYWWPLFLAGRKFEGKFDYDDFETIISHDIKALD